MIHSVPEDLERRPDPYPWLDELREAGPVQRLGLRGGLDAWIVTRYDDVQRGIADPRLSSNPHHAEQAYARSELYQPQSDNVLRASMLTADPPDHSRLRRAVSSAFTPRRVELLRPRIQRIADELLDEIAPRGHADIVADYAFPLPVRVICELLGVPVADQEKFRDWTAQLLDPRRTREAAERIRAASTSLNTYIRDLVAEKAARRGDDDLLSDLVGAGEEGRLTDDEIAATGVLLLVAGHETTVNLIGTGIRLLLRHPDQLAAVRADPALLPGAVEEFLRFDGPVMLGVIRHTTEEVEIGGVTIPPGQIVVLSIGSANHDPDRFDRPDLVDVTRGDNAHFAFGRGMHFCLGAPLARMEGDIAIGTLLRRLPGMELAVGADELVWRPNVIRGLESLPVRFTPSA